MTQNKILLSAAVQHLSTAAADANMLLHTEYVSNAMKMADEKQMSILPPLLAIADVKMSFSANVSRSNLPGGDLLLDFNRPANFRGEIKLSPITPDKHPPQDFRVTTDTTDSFNDENEVSADVFKEQINENEETVYGVDNEVLHPNIAPYDESGS